LIENVLITRISKHTRTEERVSHRQVTGPRSCDCQDHGPVTVLQDATKYIKQFLSDQQVCE